MKLIVQNEKLKIENDKLLNAKAIDQYEIEIEFSEEWDRYTKNIVYICDDKVWQEPIVNGKTTVPSLPSGQIYSIGIVGTIIENEVITERKPTNLVYHAICVSSAEYEQNQADEEVLAETYENYVQEINAKSIEIQGYLGDIETAYTNYNNNAQEKTDEYNTNATNKTGAFNNNASDKTTDYNTNAVNKTNEFNQNAEEKKAELIAELTDYSKIDETGSKIELTINSSNFKMAAILKDKNNNVIDTSNEIDLPLESVVVNGAYDSQNQKVILTLQNGNTIEFSVADLVAGLQTEITSENKLSSGLVDDTNQTNKFVTEQEKTTWNGKYEKANTGIPKTDLASDVQTSLGKADTAIQQHQDISGKEDKSNKTTTISSSSTDTQYPSALAVYNYVDTIVGDINTLLDTLNRTEV